MNKITNAVCVLGVMLAMVAPVAGSDVTEDSSPALITNQSTTWQYQFAPVPAWVIPLSLKKDAASSGEALQTLVFDRQIRVDEAGDESSYVHIRQRINNSSGLKQAGRLEIVVQPSYEQLDLHEVSLIRAGRTQSLYQADKMELLRQEGELSSSIYTGHLTLLQILEGLQVDDIIEYRYTRHGRNPVLGKSYSESWSMGWDVNLDYARLRLLLPRSHQYTIRSHTDLPKPKQEREGDYEVHTWLIENHQGHYRPSDMPAWFFPYPMVEVSEYQSWDEVAQWGHALFDPALNQSVDWPTAMTIIDNQRMSQTEKAAALLNLVQQEIRYFGIETGVNALRPSLPLETVARRYGDCKDKTVVLTRLLRQAGIEAYGVLVSAQKERGVQDLLPGPHVFDHAIVMARIDGISYWLDPTATHQGQKLENIGFFDYGYGLVLQEENSGLTELAAPLLIKDSIEVEQSFQIKSDASTELAMKFTRQGKPAENTRQSIASIGIKEWDTGIDRYYERIYAGLRGTEKIEHGDDLTDNTYTTQHHYKFDEPLKLVGSYWRLESFADNIRDFTELPQTLNRQEPLVWQYPIRVVQSIQVTVDGELPAQEHEPLLIERPAFSYRREIKTEKQSITIRHEYIARADHVAVAQMSEHLDGLRQVNEALSMYVFVNTPEKLRLNQRNEDLKSKLRDLLKKGSSG